VRFLIGNHLIAEPIHGHLFGLLLRRFGACSGGPELLFLCYNVYSSNRS